MSCGCVTKLSAISHPVEHSHQYFFVPDRITTLSLFDPFFVFLLVSKRKLRVFFLHLHSITG